MSERVAVGVDLGGTNVRVALVDLEGGGRLVADRKEPVADHRPEAVADLVARVVASVDPEANRHGVGVGFAGMLRGNTGVVVNAPNFGWREVDFRGLLRDRLGHVELFNDLNAITYGETLYGAARGARDVLCVYVGTGLGGGLVTDGRLHVGHSHLAGEIGHVKVRPGGRRCGCGQDGCIEAYVSGRNIAARAREEMAALTAPSHALALAGGSLEAVHAGHLDEAARAGDVYATALWDEIAPMLGLVLANAVTLLNPALLLLGGGVWEGAPELGRRALASFRALVNVPSGDGLTIASTTLGDNAGVLGAAALVAGGGAAG